MLLALGCWVTALVLVCTLALSFLAALGRALRRVAPENRRMEPVQVWLNLIPVFNFVWSTVTVERVAESLRNEFRERGMDGPNERYGRRTGLALLVLLVIGVLLALALASFRRASVFPALVPLALALGYWLAYWREINGYLQRLKSDEYVPPATDEGW
jgi:ABC-type dipeptide/oligopeptide/nickel transport system permease subunit